MVNKEDNELGVYKLRNQDHRPYVETIGNGGSYSADYISWSVMWDKLKDMYPTSKHEWVSYIYGDKPYFGIMQPDGSATVHCKITYETEDGNTFEHHEYLAVRDNRNQSVQNPNSAEMENAYRRALAKGVSTLTGFGIELWMGEDIRQLRERPQTYHNGTAPTPGGVTVDQGVKLDALRRDNDCPPEDKERITKMREANWEGVTEEMATVIMADVKVGIKNNKSITPTRKKKITDAIQKSNLSSTMKDAGLKWMEEERNNLECDTFVNKMVKEGTIANAV